MNYQIKLQEAYWLMSLCHGWIADFTKTAVLYLHGISGNKLKLLS